MRLQNRPHPLSLTHPSSLSIPESELGLLAASISADNETNLKEGNQEVKMGRENQDEEEIFFSRQVGSFTDISFAPHIPEILANRESGFEVGEEAAVVSSGLGDTGAGKEGREKVGSVGSLMEESGVDYRTVGFAEDDISVAEGELRGDGGSDNKSGGGGDTIGGKMVAGQVGVREVSERGEMLSISETAAVINDKTEDVEDTEEKLEDIVDGRTSALSIGSSAIPGTTSVTESEASHVRRSANSQSWSEAGETTTPLPISPRASSYSFSMEHLPPLLSYDGGEEFSHSPSLGGEIMSEEEQVTLLCYNM